MFGTTPLAYKGSSTKIHLLNEPAQIMLTKTFSIHPTDVMTHTTASTRRGSFSSNNSNSTVEISAMSTISGHGDYRSHPRASRPMTAFIPESAYTRDESRNGPISSSLPNASNIRMRTSRPGYDVRRLRRASQTSMENGTFNPMPLPSSMSHLDSLGNAKVRNREGCIEWIPFLISFKLNVHCGGNDATILILLHISLCVSH